MKITNIYKTTAALIFLMVAALWPAAEAWGQVNGDFNNYFSWPVSLVSSTGKHLNGHDAEYAVDGNSETWMETASDQEVRLMVKNVEEKPIKRLVFDLGGNESKRATEIKIESMDGDGSDWKTVATITNNSKNQNAEIVLENPIADPYIRLTFSGVNNGYVVNEVFFNEDLSSYEIVHKTNGNKWHDLYKGVTGDKSLDRFEDDVTSFTIGGQAVQPAHAVVDTIYAYPGQTVTLYSPGIKGTSGNGDANNRTYQRWYNYKNDGLFVDGMLKPLENQSGYKLANGYVGYPLTHNGGDNLYGVQFTMPENITSENQEFIIACDVSIYTDYGIGEFSSATDATYETTISAFIGENKQCYEPTIGHRLIYYVRSINRPTDVTYDDNNPDPFLYRKRVYEVQGTENYVAEYTIHFPNVHVSENTPEVLGLRMDAMNYKLPGNESSEVELTVKVESNENGGSIGLRAPGGSGSLNSITLNDRDRFFYLIYPENEIADGATTVITVRNGNTNLIKYNIIFDDGTELVTESQLGTYDPENETGNPYAYRTEEYLKEKYGEPFTELNFDYDPANADYGQQVLGYSYYPFPMPWESSSYGFHDGGPNRTFNNNTTLNKDVFTVYDSNTPVWGYYAFASEGGRTQNDVLRFKGLDYPGNTYYMSADLSDRPGVIAQLPFRETLCPGAELFVTAWVNTPHAAYSGNVDVGIRFSIMGRKNVGGTKGPWTSIYSHNSGQITKRNPDGTQIREDIDGEWQQLYFSFINGDTEDAYDEYCLQLENVSSSTIGADLFLDKIQVFMATPNAIVTQKKISCEERTLMNLKLNWDLLLSRRGHTELEGDGSDRTNAIDFCFIDSVAFSKKLNELGDEKWVEAAREALVKIGNQTDYDAYFGTLYYDLNFVKNKIYEADQDNLASRNEEDNKYYFYREGESPNRYLSVDIYTALQQNRRYMMLIKNHDFDISEDNDNGINLALEAFSNPLERCAMMTSFSVIGQNQIRMNGEVVDPTNMGAYCTGQAFSFSVQLRYFPEGSTEPVEYDKGDVYFDWFFGDKETFEGYYKISNGNLVESTAADADAVSLKDALKALRQTSKTAEAKEEDGRYTIDVEVSGIFEESHKEIIEYYLNKKNNNVGINQQLVLHKQTLEIRLTDMGLDLVVVPIDIVDPSGVICTEPSYLTLLPNGKSPVVLPGFENMSYTDYDSDVERTDYYPAMRIGLAQIKASSVKKPIKINLRNAKFAFDSGATDTPSNYNPHHIGLMPKEKELYLISSNDPALYDLLNPTDGEYDRHQYSIGKVVSFYAKPYGGSGPLPDNHMDIYFDLTNPMSGLENNDAKTAIEEQVFKPREGYEYRFGVHFEEHEDHTGQSEEDYVAPPGSCYNYMEITMKVVPEYLVWQGKVDADGKIDNWNEDSVWKRISSDKINKSEDDQSDYFDYFTNGNNQNENGYVPMLFTKVIIPENSQVALHSAGFTGSSDTYRGMSWTSARPEYIKQPTKVNIPEDASVGMTEGHPIHYDMMVFTDEQGNMSTKPFRVNLCNEIHFEPGAEMMHAELLTYKKAWVDYKLAGDRWYALSSPLKGVVSGDFYTDQSGMEEQEYFTDITWSADDNSRTNPSVYQRGWKDANANATMVGVGSGDTGERAIAGNWSAVYNKADEGYDAGTGFSLKVLDLPEGTNNATFRLPKADTKYTYSGGTTTAQETNPITRTNANKLHVTDLNSENTSPITVTLEANGNNPYYLVGNPFMAHLDMSAFFAKNSNLESKYWVVDNNSQTVAVGKEEDLTTTDPTGDATVAPLQYFFVQKANNETGELTVEFTQEMQTLGGTGDGLRSANALTITATTSDGRTSRAAVAYDMAASADYEASEDAELFLDSNLGDVPMVYTVAGTMATSINRTSELYNIPLGVYGSKQEMVTLSFGGLNQFSSATLYDAQEQTETPLREGKTVSVPAGTSGRYFLRAGTPTGNEVIARNAFLVYSVGGGKVMVTSSNTPLKDIRVYTMGGAQVRSIQASGMQQEIYLNRGIYLITVSDQDGLQETKKVLVR